MIFHIFNLYHFIYVIILLPPKEMAACKLLITGKVKKISESSSKETEMSSKYDPGELASKLRTLAQAISEHAEDFVNAEEKVAELNQAAEAIDLAVSNVKKIRMQAKMTTGTLRNTMTNGDHTFRKNRDYVYSVYEKNNILLDAFGITRFSPSYRKKTEPESDQG
jgi:hypothetical protein